MSYRSFKEFKDYNTDFVAQLIEKMIPRVQTEINLKGVLLAMINCNLPHLKTRENMKAMRQVALKGVHVLKREKQFLDKESEDFNKIAVKYYDIARRFNAND